MDAGSEARSEAGVRGSVERTRPAAGDRAESRPDRREKEDGDGHSAQGNAPRAHRSDRRDVRGVRRGQPPGPLPPAELSRDRRGARRLPRDPLPRLRSSPEPAHGERRLPRRRPDRRPARPAHRPDRPRPAARLQGEGPGDRLRGRGPVDRDPPAGVDPRAAQDARRGRPRGVRRRPGGQESRRDPLLLSRRLGHHRLPDRARAVPAGGPAHPPDDDRILRTARRASTSTPAPRSAAASSSITGPASSSARRRPSATASRSTRG